MNAGQPKNTSAGTTVLQVHASGRGTASTSRTLSDELVQTLNANKQWRVTARDLADGVPFVDDAWIDANQTAADERSATQREALMASDALVAELVDADVIVLSVPIYNFSVPATLKAWIDMIARARLTFRYTDKGPVGLLQNKKAYLIVTSGGVAVDGPMDFATPYLRQALGFVGISDVSVINADRINLRGEAALQAARHQINTLPGAPIGMPRSPEEEQSQ